MKTAMSGLRDYSKTCKERTFLALVHVILSYTSSKEGPRSCVGVRNSILSLRLTRLKPRDPCTSVWLSAVVE